MNENMQPNVGLLQLVTYVKTYTESKVAFNAQVKDFIQHQLKIFEGVLAKELPESFTDLFIVSALELSKKNTTLSYDTHSQIDLKTWWQEEINSGQLVVRVSATSKEVEDFKLLFAASIFRSTKDDEGYYYKLIPVEETNLLNTGILERPVIFQESVVDHLQAYVAEQFLKRYKI